MRLISDSERENIIQFYVLPQSVKLQLDWEHAVLSNWNKNQEKWWFFYQSTESYCIHCAYQCLKSLSLTNPKWSQCKNAMYFYRQSCKNNFSWLYVWKVLTTLQTLQKLIIITGVRRRKFRPKLANELYVESYLSSPEILLTAWPSNSLFTPK